ncbi:MAG: hypothetical protein ACYC6Y_28055, partial [Thermoguttaceae bacterium]
TFLEKPRYEDHLRPESQRALLGRILLERSGLRTRAVELLVSVLRKEPPPKDDRLYQELLEGINLERPFAEHRNPFPVVEAIEPEQALWLLDCLAEDRSEVPEEAVAAFLTSPNWRERIDVAVLLSRLGFGSGAADILEAEIAAPYPFKEIMGIGKSHLDINYRDKCYMAMALAHHVQDVERLRQFADAKKYYRDIRYGLATGLGYRGTEDGIELAVRLATGDPIAVVRRQARESLRAIQERQRLAGRAVSEIELPEDGPFESGYPGRPLEWPGPLVIKPGSGSPASPSSLDEIRQLVAEGLRPEHFRDLNNANNQAPGATHMMVSGVWGFDRTVALLGQDRSEASAAAILDLLTTPYPFAHYLALRELAREDRQVDEAALLAQLERSAKTVDPVGFYWTCEALGRRRIEAAIPALAGYATGEARANLFGPRGMGLGLPAAKAIGRIAGRLDDPQVERLLAEENVWLVAGVLQGLAESRATGVHELLVRFSDPRRPAVVRNEAAVQLRNLPDGSAAGQ